MRKIIGICGLAGAGKDTIGDYICNTQFNWEKMSFAGHLKDVVSLLFGMDRDMLAGETPDNRSKRELPDEYWSKKMEKDFTPRFALQYLGTNLLRNQLHQNIWVDCLEMKIRQSTKNIVITDVRFPNEIDMIRSIGGEIWRVERGDYPLWWEDALIYNIEDECDNYNRAKYISDSFNVHESEWKWVGYDKPKHILHNNNTKEDLYQLIKKYMS